jgi:hypothetical protein
VRLFDLSDLQAASVATLHPHSCLSDLFARSGCSSIQRTPLSKQRNKHLQTTLIEAAKMAPGYSPNLAHLYDREKQRGNANRATLAVARKLVAYLMAVDRGQTHFLVLDRETYTAA